MKLINIKGDTYYIKGGTNTGVVKLDEDNVLIIDPGLGGLRPKKIMGLLKENNMKSRLILQVHDEIIVEAVDEELEMAEKIVREEMENAQSMDVKLDVDLNTGDSWYETK